jgi:GcrA cell cycle regulator
VKWSEQPEAVETLRKLAGRGWPASDIGIELGCTKNAIIGAARRNGIPLKQARHGPPKPRNAPRTRRKMPAVPQPPTAEYVPQRAPEPPWPCSLFELTDFSCRWPIGDVGTPEFYFCGAHEADVYRGRPYCREHARLAFHGFGRREVNA